MSTNRFRNLMTASLGLLAFAAAAGAAVNVTLEADQPAYLTGATVTVRVRMDASVTPVWGGQFFLAFDNAHLAFQSVTTGSSPFVTPVSSSQSGNTITYAVGSGMASPDNFGATAATTMAVIKFTATAPITSTAALVSFTGTNTKLTDGDANIITSSTSNLSAISIANWSGTDAWVDDNYVGLPVGTVVNWPDNMSPGPHAIGVDAFATIQGGVNNVSNNGTVHVASGTYSDTAILGRTGLTIAGAGAATTTIVGSHLSGGDTVNITSSPNTTFYGFTVTRDGNNAADWAGNAKAYGINTSSSNGMVIRDCVITGNRNGLYLTNHDGATIRNNVIDNNRTGLHIVGANTNCLVTENRITNNWTDGVLFRTESAPNDTTGTRFVGNNISGNWYGQIEYRSGHPAMSKDFSGNWLGSTSPTLSAVSGGEPGYTSQIPASFPGGTATPPAPGVDNNYDIKGDYSAQFDITPMLVSGIDSDLVANGFQGDFSHLLVTPQLNQVGSAGRVQEGINLIANGFLTGGSRLVDVLAGTYKENPVANKAVTVSGPNAGIAGNAVRGAEATIVTNGAQPMVFGVTADDVTVDGFTIDGDDPLVTAAATTYAGTDANTSYGISNRTPGLTPITRLTVQNNIIKNTYMGVRMDGNGATAAVANVTRNWFDAIGTFDFGYAISMRNHVYADFTYNKVTRAWTGVHTSINSLASPNATWNISNNEMHTYGCGIANWEVDANGTGPTINANTITVEGGVVQPNNVGIWCLVYQGSGTTTITNNVITGHDIGFFVTGAYNTGANQLTIGGTNSVVGAKVAGIRYANHLNILASTPAAFLNPAHENPVGTSQLQTYIQSQTGPQVLNVSGLPITGALKDGIVESASASVNGDMRLNVTGTHGAGSSATGSGVMVEGSRASASIVANPTTFTGFAYGVQVDGGSALIQTTNLTGNTVAGIRALNNAKVDAGDCSNSNYTGMGSSNGGNTLTGYAFDNSAPWAIQDDNALGQNVYAQNNNFGAGPSNNIADLVYDHADNGANSYVIYSQSAGQSFTASATPNDYCNFAAPANVTLSTTYLGLGTVQWYDGGDCMMPGTLLGLTGTSIVIPAPTTPGVHTYVAKVNDGCATQCASTTVTVHAAPVITMNIDLTGVSGSMSRCFDFNFYTSGSCPAVAYNTQQTVAFTGGSASFTFTVPCDTYVGVSATDHLHTLRRTTDAGHFTPLAGNYTVDFTGTKAFKSGNLNDDQFIDILDFGGFISRFGTTYANGNTACGYVVSPNGPRHADFSGDGSVGTNDYTFISTQFLAQRDADFCGSPLAEAPTISIGVIDLARTDWDAAAKADLNRDGVLDSNDITFLGQHGLPSCPADFYGDGVVNVQDIFTYLTNWFAGYPAADFDGDHAINVNDIFSYLNAWFTGCN